jgi:hypothetical protein
MSGVDEVPKDRRCGHRRNRASKGKGKPVTGPGGPIG